MNRKNLPFRKNCEGYFADKKGNVLAKKTKLGYVLFPGGGVDLNECVEEGIKRETYEETGAIIKEIKFLETLKFKWGENLARTEKQKLRYKKFQGDEMSFFMGQLSKFEELKPKKEDYWEGEKLISIKKVINSIENKKPFSPESKLYHELQIKYLKN